MFLAFQSETLLFELRLNERFGLFRQCYSFPCLLQACV